MLKLPIDIRIDKRLREWQLLRIRKTTMRDPAKEKDRFRKLYGYTAAAIALWTTIVAGSLVWNIFLKQNGMRELAKNEARSLFNKDQALRTWATSHGGVYVLPDERTQPNPYLSHIPDRDITTTKGMLLTLMNPAYIVRQMMEEYEALHGIKGHLTSLKTLNPVNTPDEWERESLLDFEKGVEERSEFTEIKGVPYLRLMQPMVTEQGCLKCHGHQGYKEKDIRGGMSVSVPMTPYLFVQQKQIALMAWSHGSIFLLGVLAIGFVSKRSKLRIIERIAAEEALREYRDHLEELVEKRTGELRVTNEQLEQEIAERTQAEDEVKKVNKELRETVNELKKANKKILKQQKSVIEEERLKVLLQMAGATAHELNQPLTVLLCNIELIGRTENVPKELTATLSMIQKAGQSISSIIKKIQKVRQYDTKQYCQDHFIINLDQKINVLSVEDSDDDFKTISAISRDIDKMALSRAKSMREAVKMLQQNQFDLVFLDYLLPDGNGIDLLGIMNRQGIEVPAIFITGQGDEMVASQAIREGAYDYLKKNKVTAELLQKSIVSALEQFRLKKEVQRAQEKMAEMSTRDGLTALYNHRYFMEVLEREVARARRYKNSLVLSMLDIDHFKQVNDTYGHPAGDSVLSELGGMLKEYTRKSDLACRYGGEEFAVILPNAHSEEARIVCERFRERVAKHVFNYDASQFNISVSIGLASFDHPTSDTPFDIIVKADKALYQAKFAGRNRVRLYGEDLLEMSGKQIMNR